MQELNHLADFSERIMNVKVYIYNFSIELYILFRILVFTFLWKFIAICTGWRKVSSRSRQSR